ncbi:MAG: 3'-5' exonuclease [Patescibacteria group bacterium]
MKRHNLAFIDLETTGLDPEKHEIIELACLLAKQIPNPGKGPKLELIEEFEFKIKPKHLETAEQMALNKNGYNDADWLFAADLEQVLKTLSDKAVGASMVAHNVTFDWNFLNKAFSTTGIPNKMHYHRIDTMSMAFTKLYHDDRAQAFSLGALADFFGLKNDRAHTALADIRTTFELYKKLLGV